MKSAKCGGVDATFGEELEVVRDRTEALVEDGNSQEDSGLGE
jgi:hypothetical protein